MVISNINDKREESLVFCVWLAQNNRVVFSGIPCLFSGRNRFPHIGRRFMTQEQTMTVKDQEASCDGNASVVKSVQQELADAIGREIRAHYTEDFSLELLAESLHINKFYLIRIFKKVTGETPMHYHNGYRCEKACELLQNPAIPVAAVGEETGFHSASHFSRVFRKVMHQTPSQYRKAFLRNKEQTS